MPALASHFFATSEVDSSRGGRSRIHVTLKSDRVLRHQIVGPVLQRLDAYLAAADVELLFHARSWRASAVDIEMNYMIVPNWPPAARQH